MFGVAHLQPRCQSRGAGRIHLAGAKGDPNMLETASVAFATFFATIGPLDVAAVFAALTASYSPVRRRSTAIKGILIASIVLIPFALSGKGLLMAFGISLPALRTAGGILLLLMGIDMVFARHSGGTSTTAEEEQEAVDRDDISVFPLATPLLAGPGTIGAAILLMAETNGAWHLQVAVMLALVGALVLTLLLLLLSGLINRLLGVTGMQVVTRVFGLLLCALAVQFVFDGIVDSGIVGSAPAAPPEAI